MYRRGFVCGGQLPPAGNMPLCAVFRRAWSYHNSSSEAKLSEIVKISGIFYKEKVTLF